MAVTDLTNTKWQIDSVTCTAGYGQFDIYSKLYINGEFAVDAYYLYVGYILGGGMDAEPSDNSVLHWSSLYEIEEGNVLEFGEGQDSTNASLISWLTTHATQIEEPSSDVIETTISVGTGLLAEASVGTTKLLKAFIGNNLIFERLGGNFLTSDGKLLLTSDNKIFNVQEAVSTISFTIGNGVFQADSGMNWGDWVQSSYNTEGLTIVTGGFVYWAGSGYVFLGDDEVRYDELIIANGAYRTGGDNN